MIADIDLPNCDILSVRIRQTHGSSWVGKMFPPIKGDDGERHLGKDMDENIFVLKEFCENAADTYITNIYDCARCEWNASLENAKKQKYIIAVDEVMKKDFESTEYFVGPFSEKGLDGIELIHEVTPRSKGYKILDVFVAEKWCYANGMRFPEPDDAKIMSLQRKPLTKPRIQFVGHRAPAEVRRALIGLDVTEFMTNPQNPVNYLKVRNKVLDFAEERKKK